MPLDIGNNLQQIVFSWKPAPVQYYDFTFIDLCKHKILLTLHYNYLSSIYIYLHNTIFLFYINL